MAYQLVETEGELTEPVSLAEQKAWSKIDADYTYNDDQIEMMISTARTLIEQQLNIGLVKRTVILEWDGMPIDMPLSPTGDIASVKKDDDVLTDDKYTVTKYTAKKIAINDLILQDFNYWYSMMGYVEITATNRALCENVVYKCEYETGYEVVPKALKQAIMTQADYILKNYGNPETDVLSLDALRLCRGYGRNLPI